MRFPSRLLLANMVFALMLWAGFFVLVVAVTVGIAVFGTLNESVWEKAVQVTRWYALFVGVALVREFLPMYIAHGQTRRQFGAQAAVTVALFAPFLSALMAVGYLLETVLYNLAGRPQALGRAHLYAEPTQVPLVLIEYLVEFLAWIVAGALVGAGFYRWQGGGLLTIPIGVGLVVLAEGAIGTELRLPFLGSLPLRVDLPQSLALTLGTGLGTFLLGLLLVWAVIRDVPLRNRLS
ncbi:hypothetical protein GCM10022226_26640 [Sphaerisporangium flaviroseum]|uniref:ABC transporter permease n=1 Tax=Sphaerisporangium flaviroseum TaxID=509199 RepID=A0ABP7HVF2_9ACTN